MASLSASRPAHATIASKAPTDWSGPAMAARIKGRYRSEAVFKSLDPNLGQLPESITSDDDGNLYISIGVDIGRVGEGFGVEPRAFVGDGQTEFLAADEDADAHAAVAVRGGLLPLGDGFVVLVALALLEVGTDFEVAVDHGVDDGALGKNGVAGGGAGCQPSLA